jgi:transcriptional regulator GlxA family with amidase domain
MRRLALLRDLPVDVALRGMSCGDVPKCRMNVCNRMMGPDYFICHSGDVMPQLKRTIGVLGYDHVEALDMIGPLEAFATTRSIGLQQPVNYETLLLSASGKDLTSQSGITFRAHALMDEAPRLDTLIIAGGVGSREPANAARVATWLKANHRNIRRIASVCTGVYLLAATGLLDGRRATTHWHFAADVARKFPRITVEPNALFIKDGRFYTAAGITAGIDLALALIEEDLGAAAALAVARYLVVYVKRHGGQDQYSEPLRSQVESPERFAELTAWMQGNLRRDLSVSSLAERSCLSPRQFTRNFSTAFRMTPAAFVEELRLNEARRRLTAGSTSVERIAESVGYGSADAFRRAFQRRFGIAPSSYRQRFGTVTH